MNYQYSVLPFCLKNTVTTCQMMINKVFKDEMCKSLGVYMDDMIAKSSEEELHDQHLAQVF